jgi:hypothetical protein
MTAMSLSRAATPMRIRIRLESGGFSGRESTGP